MSCHRTREHLPLYCGGELRWWERLRCRWHLRRCPPCREELAELSGVRDLFQAATRLDGVLEPDDTQWERLRRRIAHVEPVRPATGADRARRTRRARIAAPAMAVAAFLFLVLHGGGDDPHPPPPGGGARHGPTIEYTATPGTTVMSYQTDDPRIAIYWFFSEATTEE